MISGIIKNIQIEGEDFFSFPIDVAIEHSPKISTGFFVPLGPKKRVRIEIDGNVAPKLKNYQEKGLKNILFGQNDYDHFLKRVKTGLSIFFLDELADQSSLNEEQIFSLLRKSITYLGIKEEVCDISENLIKQTLSFIKSSGHLNPLFKKYISSCQEQYVFHLLRCYISVALAQALNWPPHLSEKFVQVNLICDLQLTQNDYESYYLNPNEPDQWTEAYREHPKTMARFLERYHSHNIGKEVIKGIEYHEEHPNGQGFPYGMAAASFDQLTSIILTSRLFIKRLLEVEFSYQIRESFLNDFVTHEINSNHFKNTNKALYRILDLGDNKLDL